MEYTKTLGGREAGFDSPRTFLVSEISSKVYEHYFDYALEDFELARQLCTLLRGVEEHDTVIIRINSIGGRFDVAAQIINAIKECRGGVVGVIEQECASAATMIFLACNQWQVQPWGEMMIHNASYGAYGKAHEISARVRASDEALPEMFKEIYEGFLSEEEIENVIKGQDIYLTKEQILDRLDSVIEIRSKSTEDTEDVEEADQCVQVSKSRKK